MTPSLQRVIVLLELSESQQAMLNAALNEALQASETRETYLRTALVYEASIAELHYSGYASYPRGRRPLAEAQVRRMRQVAKDPDKPMYSPEDLVACEGWLDRAQGGQWLDHDPVIVPRTYNKAR